MKILFSDNTLSGLLNFRGTIIRRMIEEGYDVVLVAPRDNLNTASIPDKVRYIEVNLSRTGMNPFADIKYMRTLKKIYRAENPDYIFHYTIKPNIYGTIAAHSLGVRSTAIVAGVGHVFTKNNVGNRIARKMYRFAMRFSERILVLNADNRETLIKHRVADSSKLILLQGGEGVDLDQYQYTPMPSNETPVFLMICRLLYEKGYAEYVTAAELLRGQAEFRLMGSLDDHPAAVPKERLESDVRRGIIKYIPHSPSPEVASQIAAADFIVLPSFYGEGLSRVLMEGAAMGRPLIATDIAGCREAVEDGVNGYLIKPRDSEDLAAASLKAIKSTDDAKARMSIESRRKAELQFNIDRVYDVYKKNIIDHG